MKMWEAMQAGSNGRGCGAGEDDELITSSGVRGDTNIVGESSREKNGANSASLISLGSSMSSRG
ncbi:hypothetical protein AKJ16_DCAP25251 [Drosera capensis]